MPGAGPTPQERGKVLGPAKPPHPAPRLRLPPAGSAGGAAPGPGARCRARGTAQEGGRAGAPRRPVARKARAPRPAAWGRGGRACGLLGGGVQPGPCVRLAAGPPAPGSQAPPRDSPERPGSASWCPSGCPCLCSDSTWCSSPPRRRLRVALRGAGVTFKAGGQARGYAGGGGGAAPGLG